MKQGSAEDQEKAAEVVYQLDDELLDVVEKVVLNSYADSNLTAMIIPRTTKSEYFKQIDFEELSNFNLTGWFNAS